MVGWYEEIWRGNSESTMMKTYSAEEFVQIAKIAPSHLFQGCKRKRSLSAFFETTFSVFCKDALSLYVISILNFTDNLLHDTIYSIQFMAKTCAFESILQPMVLLCMSKFQVFSVLEEYVRKNVRNDDSLTKL